MSESFERPMCTTDHLEPPPTPARPAAKRVHLCVIVTVDITLQNLCRGRFEYLLEHGFDVTVVCAPTPLAADIKARGLRLHTAPLARAIAPLRDLRALWNLYRFLRRERFDLVEVSTPKAALIGAMAARLAGAPLVVYLLRGLAYQQQGALTRRLLRLSDKIACRFAHRVISISELTLEQACEDGICPRDKMVVLGHGSSNGVDLELFSQAQEADSEQVRSRLSIPDNAIIAGFVGRMTGDKGVVELVDAFTALSPAVPRLHLLLVGDYEHRDRPPDRIIRTVRQHPRIKAVGWQDDTRPYFGIMDLFVFPTHREGFGTVLLEAAAMRLPLITTRATGWWSGADQDDTALYVSIGDAVELERAMARMASDAELRTNMGAAARRRVEQCYDCRTVWDLQEKEFRRLLTG